MPLYCECCGAMATDANGDCSDCGHAADEDHGPECPLSPYHIPEGDEEE